MAARVYIDYGVEDARRCAADSSEIEDSRHRVDVFQVALKHLPVSIYVNERVNSYSVKNGSHRVIWADDLPSGGSAVLMDDLAMLLRPEDRPLLIGTFRLKDQTQLYNLRKGKLLKEGFALCSCMLLQGEPVTIGLKFGFDSDGEVYELMIEATASDPAQLGARPR